MKKLILFGCEVTLNNDEIHINMESLGNIGIKKARNLRKKIFEYLEDEMFLEEHEDEIIKRLGK